MATRSINILSICSGVGGLELGLHLALGDTARTVGYVERETYAASTLMARMEDSCLDQAPVWDDLCTFDGSAWRGCVDIITGGFPCQPWSHAGQRGGTDDARWLWPAVLRVIVDVDPRYVFLENVPGLVTGHGLEHVLSGLAEAGFDAEWDHFSAGEVGATHRRQRVFILAYAQGNRQQGCANGQGQVQSGRGCLPVAVPPGAGSPPIMLRGHGEQGLSLGVGQPKAAMGDAEGRGPDAAEQRGQPPSTFPPGPDDAEAWGRVLAERPDLAPAVEPTVCGMADGLASRVDRLRACGNGVVPLQAAYAFCSLTNAVKQRETAV